jgi:hypothetical protein
VLLLANNSARFAAARAVTRVSAQVSDKTEQYNPEEPARGQNPRINHEDKMNAQVTVTRRKTLLGATTLATASALGAGLPNAKNVSGAVPTPFDAKFRGWVNIKEFGALGDGVTDDSAAFLAFTAAYSGKSANLVIPPGTYITSANYAYSGIKKLVIWGYGVNGSGNCFTLCGGSDELRPPGNPSTIALINSAKIGDTSVTCINPSDANQFFSGDWIMVSAYDLQGYGDPPNLHFFEFCQVVSSNASTGVIALSWGLQKQYSSTYPKYNAGDDFHPDCGGPAQIYRAAPMWDTDITVYGITYIDSGFVQVRGRRIKYVDCSFPNNGFPLPSVHQYYCLERCDTTTNTIEVDKLIEHMEFIGCRMGQVAFQSSSTDRFVVDGCQIMGGLNGTPQNTLIRNSSIPSLSIGPGFYGVAKTCRVENSRIGSVSVNIRGINVSHTSLSHGVFSAVNSGPIQNSIPGTTFFMRDGGGNYMPGTEGIITDYTSDGINNYVHTTVSAIPTFTGDTLADGFQMFQCPRIEFSNCVGCQDAVDWSNARTANPRFTGKPFTYTRYILTGNAHTTGGAGANSQDVYGQLVKIRINVLQAYTGAQSSLNLRNQFCNYINSSNTVTAFAISVNCKIAGERVIQLSGVTGTQSGDSIFTPDSVQTWFHNGALFLGFDQDISGDNVEKWPIVEVEAMTDWGPMANSDNWQIGLTTFWNGQ